MIFSLASGFSWFQFFSSFSIPFDDFHQFSSLFVSFHHLASYVYIYIHFDPYSILNPYSMLKSSDWCPLPHSGQQNLNFLNIRMFFCVVLF